MKTCPFLTRELFGCLAVSFATMSLLSAEQPAPEAAPPGPPPHHAAGPEQRPGEPPRAAHLRERIRDLHAAGKHDEARQLMERVRQHRTDRPERPGQDQPPGKARPDRPERPGPPEVKEAPRPMGPPPVMKIRNLRQAAGLLEAAGYRDHAEKARQEAGRLEADVRRNMEEMRERATEKRRAMEAERRKEKERAAEGKERKDKERTEGPEKRPDADEDLRRQVKELRKELEDVRGQLRKARKEAEERKE